MFALDREMQRETDLQNVLLDRLTDEKTRRNMYMYMNLNTVVLEK